MGCQILMSSISRSMPLADAALMATGAILISDVDRVAGKVSEQFWWMDERRRNAGASESRCGEHPGLL